MWKEVRTRVGRSHIGVIETGPNDGKCYAVATRAITLGKNHMVEIYPNATYDVKNHKWDIKDCPYQNALQVVGYNENADEEFNDSISNFDLWYEAAIINSGNLARYDDRLVVSCRFNNIIANAKVYSETIPYGESIVVKQYKIKIDISDAVKDVTYDIFQYAGPLTGLVDYMARELPYEIRDTTHWLETDYVAEPIETAEATADDKISKINWNVCLSSVVDNVVQPVSNGPTESGDYLCTCISHIHGIDDMKYLHCMYWDAEKCYWSDYKNYSGTSRVVLAWTEDVKPCDFDNYKYNAGAYLTAK